MTTWIDKEENLLKEKYEENGTDIPQLLERHSRAAIREKARRMNLKTLPGSWLKDELDILKKHYRDTPKNILMRLLPDKDWGGIKYKARELNLNREHRNQKEYWQSECWLRKKYKEEKLSTKDISQIVETHPEKVRYWLEKFGIDRRHSYLRIEPDLSRKNRLSYILGVIKGDGSVTDTKIQLRQTRKTFALSFQYNLQCVNLNPKTIKHKGMYITYSASKKFTDWYKSLDIPKIKKFVNKNDNRRIEFIRGFFESDGWNAISDRNWQVGLCNTDKELMEIMDHTLTNLGFNFCWSNGWNDVPKEDTIYLYRLICPRPENKKFVLKICPRIKNDILTRIKPRKWTEEEKKYLEKNYAEKSVKELANKLGRTKKGIMVKANKLDLKKYAKKMNKRRRLYEKGLSDREIADVQNVSKPAISNWRYSRELPPNTDPRLEKSNRCSKCGSFTDTEGNCNNCGSK